MRARGIAALAAATMLVLAAGLLVGCGPDNEKLIRDAITQELESLKTHDEALMDELTADAGLDDLKAFGIEPKAFLAAYLDGFDYRIDEVSVDGDSATATVVFTCKNYSDYTAALESATAALLEDDTMANLSADQLNARIGQAVMDALAGVAVKETAPFAVEYKLADKTWSPTPNAEQAVANALFGN